MNYASSLPYKTRNTLILSCFLFLIITIGGYYALYFYPKTSKKLVIQVDRLKQQISAFDGIEAEYIKIRDLIQKEQIKLANMNKQILPDMTASKTYSYLNSILNFSGVIQFDMLYTQTKHAKGYSYRIYNIKGEGYFPAIFKFIWFVERGPQIYKINKLVLRGIESPKTGQSKIIVFEIELWSLFAPVKNLPVIEKTLDDVVVAEVNNPFNPYVPRTLPPNSENLLEVERAELKAVIPGKAFIADHYGKVHVLKEGDKVYLGYTTRINEAKSQVEFTLNKSGAVKKFILKLRFGNNSNNGS